jgi:hypothetical protein
MTKERVVRIARLAAPWAIFALSLWFLFGDALVEHMRYSANPTNLNDDARQQISPFFRYEDRTIFHDDYVGDYYIACLPIGYFALYFLGAKTIGAVALSKLLPYLLFAAMVVALAMCAHTLGGKAAAWVVSALCLGTGLYFDRMAGGLPRAFGFPLAAAAALGLARGKPRFLAALIWTGAAFYPASAPVIGFSLALLLLALPARDRGDASEWTLKRRLRFLGVTAGVAALILLPTMLASRPYGPVITPARASAFPEAGLGGRYIPGDDAAPFKSMWTSATEIVRMPFTGAGLPLVRDAKAWMDSDRTHDRFDHVLLVALVLSGLGWLRLAYLRPEARRLSVLLAAACGGNLLARTFPPFLYLPQRYFLYTLPALATLVVSTGVLGFIPPRLAERKLVWLPPLAVALGGLPLLALFGAHGSNRAGMDVRAAKTGIYAFIGKLSPEVVVAGWPRGIMDNVPYVSRRKALVTYETYQAFHARYALEMRRRTEAVIDAYFATDLAPLERLRREFGVTHLVVETAIVGPRAAHLFRPFDRRIAGAIRRTTGTELEVERQFPHAVYRDRAHVVLDLSKLSPAESAVARPGP